MLKYRNNYRLAILAVFILLLGVLIGCGGPDTPGNGDVGSPDNGETGDPGNGDNGSGGEEGDIIDISSLWTHNKDGFKDGQYFKFELWQKVDGVESPAWFSMDISESGGIYTVEYAGEFKNREWGGKIQDFEFSGEVTLSDPGIRHFEEGRFQYALVDDYISHNVSGGFSGLLKHAFEPVLENFTNLDLEYVGDSYVWAEYEIEVPGYKTFAGQKGYSMTVKVDGRLEYELCVNADLPVNLYSYTYDYSGNEYRAELVEYRD